MSKLSRFILRTTLIIALLLVSAFLYLNHGVTALHHERIEAVISDASGFEVTAGQPFDLEVGRQRSSFKAHYVSIRHPEWPDAEVLATISSLYIVVDTFSILAEPLTIRDIEITGIDLHLQQAEDRPGNWMPRVAETEPEAGQSTPPVIDKLYLDEISIRSSQDGALLWAINGDLLVGAGLDLAGPVPDVSLSLEASMLELYMAANAEEEKPEPGSKLFDETTIDLTALSSINLTASIDIDDLRHNNASIGSLSATAQILNGGLQLERIELQGSDSALSASLSVQAANDAYDLAASAQLENWRSEFLAIEGENKSSIPPFNGELELSGSGNSMQSIMASANGRLSGRHSTGSVDLQAAGPLFSDVAASLVEAINPLAESSPQTSLDCGVYEISVTNGLASVEQFSVQTDKLTVIGSGEIDLGSEAIDMTLHTKSREGLGLSIGSVATSFFKLGGTLSEPSAEVDAGGTVTTAGAAVATGGLSVLAKGLWDRLSAEADLCQLPESEQPEEISSES